jgi:hypothetical protein
LFEIHYPEIVFIPTKKKFLIENLIRLKINNYTSTLAVLKLLEEQITK